MKRKWRLLYINETIIKQSVYYKSVTIKPRLVMQIHIFIDITNVTGLRRKIVLSVKYCKKFCTLDIPYILFGL